MNSEDPHQQDVLREQTKLLFEHLPFVLIGVLASATGFTAVLWSKGQTELLAGWLLLVYLLTAVRWFTRKRFLELGNNFDPDKWINVAIQLTAASGVLWGVAGVVFFSTEPLVLMTLSIFLCAMVAGAVSSHACHTPAYIAFALPTALPFIARCVWEMTPFYVVLGLVAFVFVMVNVRYGRNLEKMVLQSIRLRFQNAELIEELTQQKRVAEQASVAKTRFLAAASHDLRQPVQAIELLVDALSEDMANHPSRGLLDKIQQAGYGLRNLLNALLDSAKINAAAITAKPRHIALAPLLKRICSEFSTQAQQKGLDIRLAKCSAHVYTDPALLELILRNYVENAIKYTPEGRVLVGCRRRGQQLRIEVHDTGIGIPASAQETVFQEFYQLGNHERDKAKGLGLGLYIAHSLGKLLSHDIGVNSTVDKGSMFYVTVPQGDANHLLDEPGRTLASNKTPLTGKTVLLIDDDDLVRASVTEMLSRWHCSTMSSTLRRPLCGWRCCCQHQCQCGDRGFHVPSLQPPVRTGKLRRAVATRQ